jgi:GR25 family glycosyltransferase involved in LPS biosynthesis
MLKYYVKDYKSSYFYADKIMKLRPGSESLDRALFNKKLMVDNYINEQWSVNRVFPSSLPNCNFITLTITSCRRLDLFLTTLESFFRCCADPWLISKFICIDDNSSEEDRAIMKEKFPFFTFINKKDYQKGHYKSMQMLSKAVKTPYMLHLEDDWLFFNEICIADMIEILEDDKNIGQVLINKNYSELPSDNIIGGIEKRTQSNLRYFIHEYAPTPQDKLKFIQRHGANVSSCYYWPHFSLRPGLLKTEIFSKCSFQNVPHFEMAFAHQYIAAKYVTAFLQDISCKHIGRLTSDRHSLDKLNAYDLLDTNQFGSKKVISAHVINLERRTDRLKQFNDQKHMIPIEVKREQAIDGKCLESSPRLNKLFEGNDYHMRRGIVGCALSHIKLWIELIQSDEDGYLIFEDDAIVSKELSSKLIRIFTVGQYHDIVFLAIIPREPSPDVGMVTYNWATANRYFKGGTSCYFITKQGANKMLKYIDRVGMTNAIDTMMLKAADELTVSFVLPSIVFDLHNDTDIQSDFDTSLDVGEMGNFRIFNEVGKPDLFENGIKFT